MQHVVRRENATPLRGDKASEALRVKIADDEGQSRGAES
jgi:hypothetical protein